jgi:hypothetical protein
MLEVRAHENEKARAEAAEAEVERLREALETIAANLTYEGHRSLRDIARSALTPQQDTDEG